MSKKEETRKKIMEMALVLFSEQGYYATTTKMIAQRAGVNEVTLFRHFGTKENLFQGLTENYVKEINIKSEIHKLVQGDFDGSILQISKDYLDFCYRNKQMYKIQMRLTDEEKDFVRLKLSRGFVEELEVYFGQLIKENIVAGEPHKMAVTLISSILGAFTIYVLTDNTFTDVPLEELVIEHAKQFSNYYRIDKGEIK